MLHHVLMMEKLKAHFLKFGPRRFVIVTVLALAVLDLINCWYLRLYWLEKGISVQLVQQSITRSGLLLEDFSMSTMNEMIAFMNNTFYFFLLVVLANNLFFYFFYLKKRLWAQGFVLFYALTAALFQLTFLIDDAKLGIGWTIYNLAIIPVYMYLFFGVKLLKAETTIPGDKKKGR